MNISQVFHGAANVIEGCGWHHGSGGNDEIGYCMQGAMRKTLGLDPSGWSFDEYDEAYDPPEQKVYAEAVQHAEAYLGDRPWRWNDRYGDKPTVIAKLREMCQAAENEGL